jgi:hypothetical protein
MRLVVEGRHSKCDTQGSCLMNRLDVFWSPPVCEIALVGSLCRAEPYDLFPSRLFTSENAKINQTEKHPR